MDVTVADQIKAVRREIGFRQRVYPRRVGEGKMTQQNADWQLKAMRAVLETLERVASQEPVADRVSIHGMYDCHLFHSIEGATVDEVIDNWRKHNSESQPAIVDGRKVDDLGPSMLGPACVLHGKTELRRVGQMVFPNDSTRMPRDEKDVQAYRAALLADPDIPRLLRAKFEGGAP